MISDEINTIITIHRHIVLVQRYLQRIAIELQERWQVHDISKLSPDEFYGFVEINRTAREYPYNSEEYKKSIKDNNAVELHYLRNSHHPEYYSNGINDMSLIDIIEMVCDWKAASETYKQTSFEDSLKIQRDRFKLEDKHVYLIELIAEAIK